jgi:hypothetical protein
MIKSLVPAEEKPVRSEKDSASVREREQRTASAGDQVLALGKKTRREHLDRAEAALPRSRPLSDDEARTYAILRRKLFKPL